jgi:hypothetical protein
MKLTAICDTSEIEHIIDKCQQFTVMNTSRNRNAQLQRERFFLKTMEKQFDLCTFLM